jgi:uncharacterized membrane protein
MDSKRPSAAPRDRVRRAVAWVSLVLAVGIPIVALPVLPAEVPRHYDLAGNVTATATKWIILLIPFGAVFLYGLLSAMQFGAPHLVQMNQHMGKPPQDPAAMRRSLQGVKACTMLMFAVIGGRTVAIALGYPDLIAGWAVFVPLAMLIGLVVVDGVTQKPPGPIEPA